MEQLADDGPGRLLLCPSRIRRVLLRLVPDLACNSVRSGSGPGTPRGRWSSHYVRVGDVLSGSGPQGLSSDPGPSSMGPVGSRSVRLGTRRFLLRLRPDLARRSVRAHVRRRCRCRFSMCGAPAPSRIRSVRLRPSGVRLRSSSVEHGPVMLLLCPTRIRCLQ